MSRESITIQKATGSQNAARQSNPRTLAALQRARRNGEFAFFCANNDFSDVDKIVTGLKASGALKGIVE